MLVFWIIILIIFGAAAYLAFKQHKDTWKKVVLTFIAVIALLGVCINLSDSSNNNNSSTSESSSSSSKTSSESSKENSEVDKARVKNTCNAINKQIAQHPELQGFKLKPYDDQFTVIVPANVLAMSDNEQRTVYQSVENLIYKYDNGTNQGTFIEFQDSNGNAVARSSYTGGRVKLMK